MTELLALIQQQIAKQGAINIASYMELALQHPQFGYYRQHDPLGADGDFITAPEISQMFGEMIGLWCAEAWRMIGAPPRFALIELGAGRGTLMQDAMRATAKIKGFHDAVQLYFFESNATLKKMQQDKLFEYLPVHLDDFNDLPQMPTLILANEFFDALPIRQFEKTPDGWCERLVNCKDNQLCFTLVPVEAPIMQLIPPSVQDAPTGTVFEVSLASTAIMRNLAKHLASYAGAGLFIDYGYSDYQGKPTLQALKNHQFADVLQNPGECDLTAHVDFGMLRLVAEGQGVHVAPLIGQGEFLTNLGIGLRAMQLKQKASTAQVEQIDNALHRLTDASQMGQLFKVLAVSSPAIEDLPGF